MQSTRFCETCLIWYHQKTYRCPLCRLREEMQSAVAGVWAYLDSPSKSENEEADEAAFGGTLAGDDE